MTDLGNRIADRYRLDALLGEGSGGRVFVALDEHSGARVAVKLLAATPSHGFDLERSALHSVRHPHLLSILETGRHAHGVFLVTELMAGGDLTRVAKPFDPTTLHAVTTQTLEALAFLHAQGILHGDVKSENVFVQSLDPPHFRLGDFGMARLHSENSGAARGSPAFMAPEIIRGELSDERSDLYALGCALYECAFGELPFADTDVRQVLLRHLNETPARLSHAGDTAVRLVRLLRSLLAKEPASRPMDARAALAAWHGEDAAVPRWVPARLGVLIGRDAEMATLEQALADPAIAVVTLEGPAGIGKTRLLREFALRAELVGVQTTTWIANRDLAEIATDLQADDTRLLAVARAAEVRRRLGNGRWILMVDDVDDTPPFLRDSLAYLLRDLARDAAADRLTIVAGRGEAGALTQSALESGGLAPASAVLLSAWEAAQVDAAASALFGARRLRPELVELLHRSSGGLPAEVEVIAQRLAQDRLLRIEADGALTIVGDVQPADVVESHSERIERVIETRSKKEREILSTLALLRSPATVELISAMHADCEPDLAQLQKHGLVAAVRRDAWRRYALAHEGLRRFLRSRLSHPARAAIHDRIATTLRLLTASAPEEDLHWHETHGSDFACARVALQELIDRPQSANQPELLRDSYVAVLQKWPEALDPEDRLHLQVALAEVLLRLGDQTAMSGCIDAALPHADPDSICQLLDIKARMYLALGRPQLSLEVLDAIPLITDGAMTQARLAVLTTRGEALGYMLRFSEALDALATASRNALVGSALFDRLLNPMAINLTEVGRLAEAEHFLAAAASHYEAGGNPRGLAIAVNRLGLVAFKRGEMQLAFEHLERAHGLFRKGRDPFGTMLALNGLGAVASELGRFAAARDYFRSAIDLGQRFGEPTNLSFLLGNLALTLGTMGEYTEALSQSQIAQAYAVERQLQTSLVSILVARAGLLATMGLDSACRSTLDALIAENPPDFYVAQQLLILAQLELQAFRPLEAAEHLTQAEKLLHACSAKDELVVHDLLKARCDWLEGKRSDAVQRLRRSCEVADSMHLRLTRTHLDAMLGDFLAELEAPEARGHAQAALEAARVMGVPEIGWRCERTLGRVATSKHDYLEARECYGRCVATFQDITASMPEDMANAYLAVPERRRVFDEIRQLSSLTAD